MCLLVFSFRQNKSFPLVVAANRDEFHARPTAPATFWPDIPHLLAGKDLQLGGTWMGLTRQGRFAAITNTRDPDDSGPAPRSRGELPLEYLKGTQTPSAFLSALQPRAHQYAGFNLLVGGLDELWYFSNAGLKTEYTPKSLSPGLYGLSNARLDTPWPKVLMGKQKMTALLKAAEMTHDNLATLVEDRSLVKTTDLQRLGLTGEMEYQLSSQFIVTPRYGTRSSTTMWITDSGTAHWRETSYGPDGLEVGRLPHDIELGADE
ncbi:MAG: NRDE family protein [Pseudomonadota bacterium]